VSDDATVRALLQQVRRRANLLRDAAIALTTETARAGEIVAVEWPAEHTTAQWPPSPREPRPWLAREKGEPHE
jgi:hypothetical protein